MNDFQNVLVRDGDEYFVYPRDYFLQIVKETIYFCNRKNQCFLWFEIPCKLSNQSNLLLYSLLSTEHIYILGHGNGYFWSLFRGKDLRFLENIKTRIIKEVKEMGCKLPSDFRFNVYFYSGKSYDFVYEENRFIRKWNKKIDFFKVKRITIEHVNKKTFRGVYILIIKRFLDIIGSLFGIIIFSWVMLACAVCVKIALLNWKLERRKNGDNYKDSVSTVIFKQIRVGRDGKLFKCYKFRTMYPGADKEKEKLKKIQYNTEQNVKKGPTFKMDNDPRILKFGGNFLRKHSLDELPQFFNVLIGDMSLVGPRPPTPDEVSAYLSWHYNRLSIKPGLTCTWQTGIRNDIDFEEWMRLDNRYIQERSMLNDLKLKLKTIDIMISGKGAS